MHEKADPKAAATDVGEFITDLDGGQLAQMLSVVVRGRVRVASPHTRFP
jgi:hypothetical protein